MAKTLKSAKAALATDPVSGAVIGVATPPARAAVVPATPAAPAPTPAPAAPKAAPPADSGHMPYDQYRDSIKPSTNPFVNREPMTEKQYADYVAKDKAKAEFVTRMREAMQKALDDPQPGLDSLDWRSQRWWGKSENPWRGFNDAMVRMTEAGDFAGEKYGRFFDIYSGHMQDFSRLVDVYGMRKAMEILNRGYRATGRYMPGPPQSRGLGY